MCRNIKTLHNFAPPATDAEIRAYYACPPGNPASAYELGGFDYPRRGYPNA